ncbi:MAG: hypothetical protein Q8L27_03385 [archaeon]|nr:hypothetical protein [archaeon]
MKKGKGSVKIILISLILLLFLEFVFLGYILMNPGKNIGGLTGFAISEERTADNLRFNQYECLKELSIKGINLFEKNEKEISNYIYQEIDDCFKETIKKYSKKYTIEANLESIQIDFNENYTEITASFPILIDSQLFNDSIEVKL